MKEIIFLNFGNTSNFISSHFWNLNDELMKTQDEESFKLLNNVIYNDYSQPRNLIFDYSENIRPYYIENEKLGKNKKKAIEEEIFHENEDYNVQEYQLESCSKNKFINMLNEFDFDEEEFAEYKKTNENKYKDSMNDIKTDSEDNKNKLTNKEIFALPEEKIYDYFDFNNTIRNWNDFLQPRFPNKAFNEVKTADVDILSRNSYIKGYEFLSGGNFNYSYFESFENNFRKYLEDCDRLELIHINVDFNSFWGGICNKMMESFEDQIPKTLKFINGTDFNSSFYQEINGNNQFHTEKCLNYLWFFTDLQTNNYSNILFLPMLKHQTPSHIKNIFNFNCELSPNESNPVFDYYYSSLAGLNLLNLYMPLRSRYYNNSAYLNDMIHANNLNFVESDIVFLHESMNKYHNLQHNGILWNFSKNMNSLYGKQGDSKEKKEAFRNYYFNCYKMKKHNSTIIHGYNEKFLYLGEKLDSFLIKHSALNYTSVDKFKLPYCFPRKYHQEKKEYFVNDISAMSNFRPFPEFPLKYLKYFPDYFKDYDLDIKKYLINHDNSLYVEYLEKIEDFHAIKDTYEYFDEFCDLGINRGGDEDYDDDDI
jgi:hypothetical protein